MFLLAKAYQKAQATFKQKLIPFGITPVQNLILAVLSEEDFLSPAEISDRIAMDGATLSGSRPHRSRDRRLNDGNTGRGPGRKENSHP